MAHSLRPAAPLPPREPAHAPITCASIRWSSPPYCDGLPPPLDMQPVCWVRDDWVWVKGPWPFRACGSVTCQQHRQHHPLLHRPGAIHLMTWPPYIPGDHLPLKLLLNPLLHLEGRQPTHLPVLLNCLYLPPCTESSGSQALDHQKETCSKGGPGRTNTTAGAWGSWGWERLREPESHFPTCEPSTHAPTTF